MLLIAISVNLDNLCIGMSLGLSGKRMSIWHNLIVASVSGLIALIGCALAGFCSGKYLTIALYLGAAILIGYGAYTAFAALRRESDECVPTSSNTSTIKDVLVLSAALAINCLPASVGAGLSGIGAPSFAIAVAAFSFITVYGGSLIGNRAHYLLSGRWLDVMSGLVLVAIGIWEIFI